jgi:glucose dehydrogenase
MATTYDYIVIGSGVAGALSAYKLAQKPGKPKVLLIEAADAPWAKDPQFKQMANAANNAKDIEARKDLVKEYALSATRTTMSPYLKLEHNAQIPSPDGGKRDHLEHYYEFKQAPGDENEFWRATYQRLVGGSTWTWRGNCPRFLPNDFLMKSKYGQAVDWPWDYAALEPYFVEAEKELGVACDHDEWEQHNHGAFRSAPFPMPPIAHSYSDRRVMERLGPGFTVDGVPIHVLHTPQARNSVPYNNKGKQAKRPACEGNGNCIPICPIQAKYDATVHLKLAKKLGVEIWTHCAVHSLELEPGTRNIGQVVYIDWKSGSLLPKRVKGRQVVLAMHAIEVPRILLFSGIANLMDHLNNELVGLMPEHIFTFRGPQGTASIPAFCDGPFRSKRSAYNITFGNDGWGRTEDPGKTLSDLVAKGSIGKELRNRFTDRVWRQVRFSFSSEQLPREHNKVTLGDRKDPLGIPVPRITNALDDYSRAGFFHAQSTLKTIMQKLQCTEIKPQDPILEFRTAGHIMGTTRMGTDPNASVVDADGRSHDHPNLWIVGSSVFPTGATANPTLTIAAVTLRTLDKM